MNYTTKQVAASIRARHLFLECTPDYNLNRREAKLYGLVKLADDAAARLAHMFEDFDRPAFMRSCGFDTTAVA